MFGDETKKISGKLIRINGEDLIFSNNWIPPYKAGDETIINFNNIINAKVIVSFS
jgi:hypothetical protein